MNLQWLNQIHVNAMREFKQDFFKFDIFTGKASCNYECAQQNVPVIKYVTLPYLVVNSIL